MLWYECDYIQALSVTVSLGESGKFIDSSLVPLVSDLRIRVLNEVSVCHPSV